MAEIDLKVQDEGVTDETERRPEIPEVLSILPLRDSVIYPMLIAPLSVGRPPSVQLIDDTVSSNNRIIGVIAQKDPTVDFPKFSDVYGFGCAVIIRTLVKLPDAVRLIVQGVVRFRIVEAVQEEPYLRARIELVEEQPIDPKQTDEVEALRRTVSELFERCISLSPQLPDELRSLTQAVHEPNVMGDLITAHMPFAVEDKQQILETIDIRDRLRMLVELLGREARVLELSSKVQSEVNTELSKSQRDYYLREQLRAIQRELGDGDDREEELEELRARIDAAQMPEDALKEVNRELDRLRRMSPGAPEYTVARTYIDWMVSLPWAISTEDILDLPRVRKVLDADHYGLEKVKERILEFLAVRKFKKEGTIRQPILCFVGPPGVGKTSLGRSIAHAMGRKFLRIALGGMRDEAEIRGHRRTYIGAMPGQVVQGLRRVSSNNPVFMLDEVDKLGTDFRGDPSSALLEVLDPEQNNSFRDHYIDAPFDLSRVFFITTANVLDTVPPPLRDRMEVIELGGYTEEEKVEIARRHLVPKQMREHGLDRKQMQWSRAALRHLVRFYTREAGVRNLEREIAAVCRKVTRMFAEGRTEGVSTTPECVEQLLGSPRFLRDEIAERTLKPGVAVGIVWTPVGGEIVFVESAAMPGSGSLVLTGQLGDVMKESARAALSYLRTHAREYEVDPEAFVKSDIHVHVPAGAIPKDGPSAGVTLLTALTSLMTGKKINDRLAMTGEVTLSGDVLPVGGIKEKVLAAHRAGIRTVVLPEQNRKDYLEEIPADIREKLDTRFVRTADEVLAAAFEKPARNGKHKSKVVKKKRKRTQRAR
ncbi:endopeptidase La [Fimbriimonadia bacterium ATM]|nr:MAG: endopeptidase La [Armatimonadota bacterium]MBC6968975.1 endopeptidase La [Armatimonadota bacterium]MCE7900104.1 endopeptidase La [Armatimonadetes bacterium ATM1]MDL1929407.1 endopeptidase La [Fimbriimonadia bacterium ATM]RIJ95138.1 MAG: endopeptidase La [Armatimonadota bacterium]